MMGGMGKVAPSGGADKRINTFDEMEMGSMASKKADDKEAERDSDANGYDDNSGSSVSSSGLRNVGPASV